MNTTHTTHSARLVLSVSVMSATCSLVMPHSMIDERYTLSDLTDQFCWSCCVMEFVRCCSLSVLYQVLHKQVAVPVPVVQVPVPVPVPVVQVPVPVSVPSTTRLLFVNECTFGSAVYIHYSISNIHLSLLWTWILPCALQNIDENTLIFAGGSSHLNKNNIPKQSFGLCFHMTSC